MSLSEKEIRSKRGRSSKIKGANYERKVAKIYKEFLGVDLVRTPLSGGFQKGSNSSAIKGDISCIDDSIDFLLHTECKNQKTLKVRDWLQQANEDCPEGHIPTLVIHLGQLIKDGKVKLPSNDVIMLNLDDFLNIVDKEKILKRRKK